MKHPQDALLILLRHGQSQWNQKNLFTGWIDIPLTKKGIEEALHAGKLLKNIPIDLMYTSTLLRAQMTAMLAMADHGSGKTPYLIHEKDDNHEWYMRCSPETQKELIPMYEAWELNERMYGDLQGFNKQETLEKYGEEKFTLWRRSYDVPPPRGESLELTAKRCLPFFDKKIIPNLKAGKNVLISAHGNTIRSMIMELDQLSKEEVIRLEIPTGEPICYRYKEGSWKKESIEHIGESFAQK